MPSCYDWSLYTRIYILFLSQINIHKGRTYTVSCNRSSRVRLGFMRRFRLFYRKKLVFNPRQPLIELLWVYSALVSLFINHLTFSLCEGKPWPWAKYTKHEARERMWAIGFSRETHWSIFTIKIYLPLLRNIFVSIVEIQHIFRNFMHVAKWNCVAWKP